MDICPGALEFLVTPLSKAHKVQEKATFLLPTLPNIYYYTCLTALFPGLPRWACTRKVKSIWILLKQETVSDSGISWAICKSAPRSRQITTPPSHHSVFTGRMPFLLPTNSVKALKALYQIFTAFKQFFTERLSNKPFFTRLLTA